PARSAATAVPDAAPLWVGTGRDQAREPSAEAGHVECRGAADAPGAGPRPREETGGRREAAVPEGPPRVVRRRGPGTPRETGRPAGKGEGAHRIEAEAPDLRPYGRRGGVARLDETRVADGAAREKADEVHAKAVEMREKVLSIKGAKRAEARESRDLLRQQNRSVRAALLDEKKLEASADAALKALFEKGKVEIGR